jgi:hypothetical protein
MHRVQHPLDTNEFVRNESATGKLTDCAVVHLHVHGGNVGPECSSINVSPCLIHGSRACCGMKSVELCTRVTVRQFPADLHLGTRVRVPSCCIAHLSIQHPLLRQAYQPHKQPVRHTHICAHRSRREQRLFRVQVDGMQWSGRAAKTSCASRTIS